MLTASQLKYAVLGQLSAVRQKIQYRNFRPVCGDDAVITGIDDQVAYLTGLLDRGNMELFLKRLAELMAKKLLYGPLRGRALFVPQLDELVRRASLVITPKPNPPTNSKLLVHITSQVYPWGGHTRVIEDIAASLPEYQHELIVTEMEDTHPDLARVKPRFDELNLRVRLLSRLTREERATELSSLITALAPDAIVFLAFSADTAAHVGVAAHSAQRVLFLHAGDHHPSLGAFRPDYTHVDLTPACHKICASHSCLHASMLNLTVKDLGTVQPVERRPILGATCGSPHKYAGSTEFSYAELLSALFAAGVDQLLHIGEMPEEQKNRVRSEITANGQDASRVVFLPNTPFLTAKLLETCPDFYLISHPIGSGKATVEALSVGLPILHPRPASGLPLLFVDMTFGNAVTIRSLEETLPAVLRLRTEMGTLAKHSRQVYERHYSPTAFRETLRSLIEVSLAVHVT